MSTCFAIVLVDKRKEGEGTSCFAYMKLVPSTPASAMGLWNGTDREDFWRNFSGPGNTF